MKPAVLVLAAALTLGSAARALAHCEVPCGIYGDQMRFDMIAEHIQTVEKAIQQITELSAAAETNRNQLIRWVTNKEEHATYIQDIVSQYFLTQRVKPGDASKKEDAEKYATHLRLCHEMLVVAMKCKQTLDLANVEALKSLNQRFRDSYLGPAAEAHKH